jgi:hypothetical protein
MDTFEGAHAPGSELPNEPNPTPMTFWIVQGEFDEATMTLHEWHAYGERAGTCRVAMKRAAV